MATIRKNELDRLFETIETYRVQFAWDKYLMQHFYNNPNEPFNPTYAYKRNDGEWCVTRPTDNAEIELGKNTDTAIEVINKSAQTQGVRVSKVQPK